MHEFDDHFRIQVALRDSRNLGAIMAMDRLSRLPETEKELKQGLEDLGTVRSFFESQALPAELREAASKVFIEHGKEMARHYRAGLNKQ